MTTISQLLPSPRPPSDRASGRGGPRRRRLVPGFRHPTGRAGRPSRGHGRARRRTGGCSPARRRWRPGRLARSDRSLDRCVVQEPCGQPARLPGFDEPGRAVPGARRGSAMTSATTSAPSARLGPPCRSSRRTHRHVPSRPGSCTRFMTSSEPSRPPMLSFGTTRRRSPRWRRGSTPRSSSAASMPRGPTSGCCARPAAPRS